MPKFCNVRLIRYVFFLATKLVGLIGHQNLKTFFVIFLAFLFFNFFVIESTPILSQKISDTWPHF